MQQVSKNIGKDGMMLDVHPSVQSATSTRKVKNFRVITRDNNSYILTSIKGNELKGSITNNYIPIAVDDWNGIAYILSAEVIDGVATGRGELGTFPSPAYTGDTGNMVNLYKPLKNYGGDTDSYPSLNGDFNSALFNLDLINIVDIELQNDYDRSINIILADGKNPLRIINSGFALLPNGTYEIPDRSSLNDTNKYSADNFTNTINLILRTKKIIKVEFVNSEDGGSIVFGNYQYFFALATSDGNETEIIAQSLIVPVFNGSTFLSIAGGKNTGDKSTKQNKLRLSNLDTTYSSVVVFISHSDGMNGEVTSYYRINKRFLITASTIDVNHTGFEELIRVPLDSIQDTSAIIDTASTISQSQGHLIIANVKEKAIGNEDFLADFVRNIRLGHKVKTLDIIGPELNNSVSGVEANYNRFSETLSSNTKLGTDGSNGGYMNPKNVHDRLGYWGGESYPFSARLIRTDGTLTKLFPVSGIDNLNNNNLVSIDTVLQSTLNSYNDLDGFAADGNAGKLINTKGIYRFPNRNTQVADLSPSTTFRKVWKIIRNNYVWDADEGNHVLDFSEIVDFNGFGLFYFIPGTGFNFLTRTGYFTLVDFDPATHPRIVSVTGGIEDSYDLSLYADDPIGPGDPYTSYDMQLAKTNVEMYSSLASPVPTEEMLSFATVGAYKEARIKIYGITFKIPNLTSEITDNTIGIQFYRGNRIKDAIVQGLFFDAEIIPPVRFDDNNTDQRLWNYSGFPNSYKLIPSFDHILEGSGNYNTLSGIKRSNILSQDGIVLTKLDPKFRTVATVMPGKMPFTFLSTDMIVNPQMFSSFTSQDIYSKMLFKVSHRLRIKTGRIGSSGYSIFDNFSVASPVKFEKSFEAVIGKASWCPEKLEEPNLLKFSSEAYFQSRFNSSGLYGYTLYRNMYNNYMGIVMDNATSVPSIGSFGNGLAESAEIYLNALNSLHKSSYLGNIYSGVSIRTQQAIKALYSDLSDVQYFPISNKMYWNNSTPEADISNTLESQLNVNRKITLYGGDCYINFALRKLYLNAELFDESRDTETVNQTGFTLALINEANFNASFRSSETIDLNEGEREFPNKYITSIHTVGNDKGKGNQWRDYRKFESNIGNKGYGSSDGKLITVLLDNSQLYTASNWFTRVWNSPKHIPNSYENGYRKFLPGDYQDYDPKNGQIIKVINNNGKLFCIQERGIGIIPINERIQTGSDSAGAIYVESSGVLGPFMGILSENIGSSHKNSIVSTDNAVYGVNLDRFIIWKAENGKAIDRISSFSILSFLEQSYKGFVNDPISLLDFNIVSIWDKKNDEVLFTFYHKEVEAYTSDRNFTVAYNELTRKFHAFISIIPHKYFRVFDDLYSFNIKTDQNKFWLHDSENVPYYSFYGQDQDARIAFVVNPESDINKVFDVLEIISNRCKPASINYYVQGAKATQTLVSIPGDIIASNIRYTNETWRLPIPKATLVHDQDIEQQETDVRASADSLLGLKSRLKGKYLIVELVYDNQTLAEVQSIFTTYQIMK